MRYRLSQLSASTGFNTEIHMRHEHVRASGFVGRFLGSWKLALGELVIVTLGVPIALSADQWMQAREEAAREIGYL